MAIEVLRRERSAAELRKLARSAKDTRQARRLLSIALVLDGASREEAGRSGGMDRQTLRDWVHRYNELGLEGLRNRPNLGAPPRSSRQNRNSRWRRGCGKGVIPSATRWYAGDWSI